MPTPSLRGLHLHLDPVSGIAGDMTVAALVDAGVPASVVSEAIAAVGVPGLRVRFETRQRGAYVGRGFVVEEPRQRGQGSAKIHKKAPGDHAHAHHDHDHDHSHTHGHDHTHGPGDHRDYADIRRLIARARLDADAKALAQEIFARLAKVEAALHG
jgi:uncharacterized protein (DUF111 family)